MRLVSRRFPLPFFLILTVSFPLWADVSQAARDPEFTQILASLGPDSPYVNGDMSAAPRPDVIYPKETFFPIPLELKTRVDFWKKIYSRYTTRQVVIHDRDDLDIIYEVVDLDRAHGGRKLSYNTERRYIKQRRNHIEGILDKLYRNRGKAVTAEEKAIAARFDVIPGYRKFHDAAGRVRSQLGQADRFREGLARSGRYIRKMREIFISHGLPEELTALPHVESSFNYEAYSSAGAAGIWQFTRGTGRLFMEIGYTVDERRDPIVATHAAAKLLRQNYQELGSWPLAITAYNHGVNGMRRAKKHHGTDIARIIEDYNSRMFGFASKNFYCEFLAALDVVRNYQRHFGHIDFEPEFVYDEAPVAGNIPARTLAARLGVPVEILKEFNPALRQSVWKGHRSIPGGVKLRVPAGMGDHVIASIGDISSRGHRFAVADADGNHIVRKGETLGVIARIYGASVSDMKSANGLRSDTIYPGQRLIVPASSSSASAPAAEGGPDGYHRVRPGESLYLIARKYGMTAARLASINDISMRDTIYPGQKLTLKRRENAPVMLASIKPAVATSDVSDGFEARNAALTESPEAPGPVQEPEAAADGESVVVNGRTLRVRASDFAVRMTGENIGVITVKAEESFALYADWLRTSKRGIERLNRRRGSGGIQIGQEVTIPLDRVSKESFEKKRLEYHMGLMEDFFAAYRIDGEKQVSIDRGQSLWDLCVNKNDTPIWLARLYNPDLELDSLAPGDTITMPVVVKK